MSYFAVLFIMCILIFTPINLAHGSLTIQYSLGMINDQEEQGAIDFSNNHLRHEFFLGVAFGPSNRIVLGQNFLKWSREVEVQLMDIAEDQQEINLTEMGPRLLFYLNKNKNFYLSGAYHFYVRGERENLLLEEDLQGKSFLGTFGMQMNLTSNLLFGLSFNYHKVELNESTFNSQTSQIDHDYVHFYPSLELSYRFGNNRSRHRGSWPRSWHRPR